MKKLLLFLTLALAFLAPMNIRSMNNDNKIPKTYLMKQKLFYEGRKDNRLIIMKKIKNKLENAKTLTKMEIMQDLNELQVREKEILEEKKFIEDTINLMRSDYRFLASYIIKGQLEFVELLLKKGVSPSLHHTKKTTVLMYAINSNQTSIAKRLIESGADLTIKNIQGYTALDFAKYKNNKEIIELIDSKLELEQEFREALGITSDDDKE